MNVFKILYCRTFQFVFKVAIPILPYRRPQILQSVEAAADKLHALGSKRVFIVTDAGVRDAGLCDRFVSALGKNGIDNIIYDKTMPNPTAAAVEDARNEYVTAGCDAIAAIGGGSAMDLAKACGARIVRPKKNLNKMAGLLHVRKRLPPLFAVPTTAGTGSETTIAAVITDGETHRKYAVNDFSLIPHFAVLDSSLTIGLPKTITAYTGMDALTHAVEAYIGRSTTKDTRAKAVEAVRLIRENLKTCYDEPSNANARNNMLYAAHYAGIAFTKSYVGYVHAVAHSLSGRYGLPHGLTCAVLLPVVLESYGKRTYKRLAKLYPRALENDEYGKIISERHFERVKDLICGNVVCGGNYSAATQKIEPTVIFPASLDDPAMREEIFGPILPVLTYKTDEELFEILDKNPTPLAFYLFTSKKKAERYILPRVRFGGGCVNDTVIHIASSLIPFGGVGSSGIGSYHGKKSFETFSHMKSVLKKSNAIDLPIRYTPYTKSKDKMIRFFMK